MKENILLRNVSLVSIAVLVVIEIIIKIEPKTLAFYLWATLLGISIIASFVFDKKKK